MSDLLSIRDVEFINAVKELKEKLKTSHRKEIAIHCFGCDTLLDFGSFNLFITDDAVWCLDRFNNKNVWMDEEIPLHKAKKMKDWYYDLISPSSTFKLYFLENLAEIKKEFDNILKQAAKEKEVGLQEINEVISFLPKEEKKEEKEEVNIIDFGYRTIEIISNGSITLIDKTLELEKQKQIKQAVTILEEGRKSQIQRFVSTLKQAHKQPKKKLVKVLKKGISKKG